MKEIYRKKGYPEDWIEKRSRGIAVRNQLTDEWQRRGLKKSIEYAILTNDIMEGTFGMGVKDYKDFKDLDKENLWDHMDDMELTLTMLGEATTNRLSQERKSKGFNKLQKDALEGGSVAGKTREEIEKKTKKKLKKKGNNLGLKGEEKFLVEE